MYPARQNRRGRPALSTRMGDLCGNGFKRIPGVLSCIDRPIASGFRSRTSALSKPSALCEATRRCRLQRDTSRRLVLRALAELAEQVADDRFGLELFGRPPLGGGPPRCFTGLDRLALVAQLLFARRNLFALPIHPLREQLPFGAKFFALLVHAQLSLLEFLALLNQRFARVAVILGEDGAGFVDAAFRNFGARRLRELRRGLFDRQSQFQSVPVGLFELGPQAIETLPPRFQVFGVQSEHVLLAAEIGLLRIAFGFPGDALGADPIGI